MSVVELQAWKRYSKNKELQNINWEKLRQQVNQLGAYQRKFPRSDLIEENPPTIEGSEFMPGGWIGTYKIEEKLIRVVPNPEKIPTEELDQIRRELLGWLEYIGPFLEDLFKFYFNETVFKRQLYATFSRRLIEYTEILVSHFLPRDSLTKEYVGQELRGPPSWKKTLTLRSKGSSLIASRRVVFTLRTISNLLVTRFHAELLRDMNQFLASLELEDSSDFGKAWKIYRMRHEEFTNTGIWADFLEESLDQAFESLDVLAELRMKAKPGMLEIVDLWEAYITNRLFLSDFGNRFDSALKPLSKIYELWCFKKLCDILEIDRRSIRSLPCRTTFKFLGRKARLWYNTTKGLGKYSGLMKQLSNSIGRPDFAFEIGRNITCIIDAKCKFSLDKSDAQRFLSYLFDYQYPKREQFVGIIFYISKRETIRRIKLKNCEISMVSMTPSTYPDVKDEIRDIIESTA